MMANDASSGVGNSSAQTVDAHVPREWEEPASEALREGWSEAEVCAEEVAAPLEPFRGDSPREPVTPSRGNCQQERRTAPSGSSYRQGRRKAPSGSNSTAQSTAPSGRNCRQGNRTAPSGSNSTAQSTASSRGNCRHGGRDAASGEQPAELAASGRATCRTGSIGKSTFCQIMVPKGQVLRG